MTIDLIDLRVHAGFRRLVQRGFVELQNPDKHQNGESVSQLELPRLQDRCEISDQAYDCVARSPVKKLEAVVAGRNEMSAGSLVQASGA